MMPSKTATVGQLMAPDESVPSSKGGIPGGVCVGKPCVGVGGVLVGCGEKASTQFDQGILGKK